MEVDVFIVVLLCIVVEVLVEIVEWDIWFVGVGGGGECLLLLWCLE